MPTTNRSRRGANAVEFGLTLPIFVMILMALIDFGWLFAAQAGLNNAATVACREGSMVDVRVGDPETIARTEMRAMAGPWCGGVGSPECTVTTSTELAVPNRTLVCEVQKTFKPLVGFLPNQMLPNTVQSTIRYRLEWQRSVDTGGT